MLRNVEVRRDIPSVEVYVQQPDRSLVLATQTLADDVRGDLSQTRAQIVEQFGQQDIPPVTPRMEDDIARYFSEQNRSLPQSVVIDPATDALALRRILQDADFPSPNQEGFFTGANGQLVSPGGAHAHDLVVFHNWGPKHVQLIREFVDEPFNGASYAIKEEPLAKAAELATGAFVVHEFEHLAGGMAVTDVAVEEVDGKYQLADSITAGFSRIQDRIPAPAAGKDGDYYTGPIIDEASAALSAGRFVQAHEWQEQSDSTSAMDHHWIRSSIIRTDGKNNGKELQAEVAGLYSNEDGAIVEELDKIHPGILNTMRDIASGKTDLSSGMDKLKTVLPSNVMNLLNIPHYSARRELHSWIDTHKTQGQGR